MNLISRQHRRCACIKGFENSGEYGTTLDTPVLRFSDSSFLDSSKSDVRNYQILRVVVIQIKSIEYEPYSPGFFEPSVIL